MGLIFQLVSVWSNLPVMPRNYETQPTDFRAVTTQPHKGIPLGKDNAAPSYSRKRPMRQSPPSHDHRVALEYMSSSADVHTQTHATNEECGGTECCSPPVCSSWPLSCFLHSCLVHLWVPSPTHIQPAGEPGPLPLCSLSTKCRVKDPERDVWLPGSPHSRS